MKLSTGTERREDDLGTVDKTAVIDILLSLGHAPTPSYDDPGHCSCQVCETVCQAVTEIRALRRAPDGVVVAEWDFLDGRPGDDWSICVDGGIDLSQFDGHRVRVIVERVQP